MSSDIRGDIRDMTGMGGRQQHQQFTQPNTQSIHSVAISVDAGMAPASALAHISFLLSDQISAAAAEAIELREIADRAFWPEPPAPPGAAEIPSPPMGTVAEITQKLDTLRDLLITICHHRTRLQQLT